MILAGLQKRKFQAEMIKFKSSLKHPIKSICSILPQKYDESDFIDLFKKYYPAEWNQIIQIEKLYKSKNKHLLRSGKKERYETSSPSEFIKSHTIVKNKLKSSEKLEHFKNFSSSKYMESLNALESKRSAKIEKYFSKIENARHLAQKIEPTFIQGFIRLFHLSKNHNDKVELFNELTKYYCDATIQFFYKLNDSEHNDQIRMMAFYQLQNWMLYVKLRKKFKGKKKSYYLSTSTTKFNPKTLLNRIESNNYQSNKRYDIFISHSFQDASIVTELKEQLNHHNFNIYYDWSSDNDFLKRELISPYTTEVLKKRIEQSNIVLFIQTTKSIDSQFNILSPWVTMEVEHAKKLSKPIYCLNLTKHKPLFDLTIPFSIQNGNLIIELQFITCAMNKQ